MGKKFSQMITGEENSRIYKDPQEFMFGEEHTEASEVWSLGLRLFYAISGRDYFDVSGVPEDECFMMADPDSDSSLIIEKYIPDEYTEFAGLLKDATVFRRDGRISPDYFLSRLSEYEIRQDAEKN
ncbi:hypothetical protein [Ruminococcus sp. HUN007]|uniref:hypothetical protein n=1 Tax=Ruminococcus sp. HUN007 TaxID=1514668 RepID=UPI0005D1E7D9|nr:hypothetical protein [Ruminococcus sp. HUN007]